MLVVERLSCPDPAITPPASDPSSDFWSRSSTTLNALLRWFVEAAPAMPGGLKIGSVRNDTGERSWY
jgi:hypothetical protein